MTTKNIQKLHDEDPLDLPVRRIWLLPSDADTGIDQRPRAVEVFLQRLLDAA